MIGFRLRGLESPGDKDRLGTGRVSVLPFFAVPIQQPAQGDWVLSQRCRKSGGKDRPEIGRVRMLLLFAFKCFESWSLAHVDSDQEHFVDFSC
jgi:hypothetical protein